MHSQHRLVCMPSVSKERLGTWHSLHCTIDVPLVLQRHAAPSPFLACVPSQADMRRLARTKPAQCYALCCFVPSPAPYSSQVCAAPELAPCLTLLQVKSAPSPPLRGAFSLSYVKVLKSQHGELGCITFPAQHLQRTHDGRVSGAKWGQGLSCLHLRTGHFLLLHI